MFSYVPYTPTPAYSYISPYTLAAQRELAAYLQALAEEREHEAHRQELARRRALATAQQRARQHAPTRLSWNPYYGYNCHLDDEDDEEDEHYPYATSTSHFRGAREAELEKEKRAKEALAQMYSRDRAHEEAEQLQAQREAQDARRDTLNRTRRNAPQSPRRATASPHRAQASPHITTPIRTPSPVQQNERIPSKAPSLSIPSHTEEERDEAATRIAAFFRRARSLRSIRAIHSKFDDLRAQFTFPSFIDFELTDGSTVSVATADSHSDAVELGSDVEARLAYSSHNMPVHAYTEALIRLLNELDAVQSGGDRGVREERREVVRAVEAEAARVEKWWKGIWLAHVRDQRGDEDTEMQEAGVIEEQLVSPPPAEGPREDAAASMLVDAPETAAMSAASAPALADSSQPVNPTRVDEASFLNTTAPDSTDEPAASARSVSNDTIPSPSNKIYVGPSVPTDAEEEAEARTLVEGAMDAPAIDSLQTRSDQALSDPLSLPAMPAAALEEDGFVIVSGHGDGL